MVSVTGPLATLDPGNQEKGNPEALGKTGFGAEGVPNSVSCCWLLKV